jgi:hypothetical protein
MTVTRGLCSQTAFQRRLSDEAQRVLRARARAFPQIKRQRAIRKAHRTMLRFTSLAKIRGAR